MMWPWIGERMIKWVIGWPALDDAVDLIVLDAPSPQLLSGHLLQSAVAVLARIKQVLHGDNQIGAIQFRQRLALLDVLAGDVDVELVDPRLAGDADRDASQFALVKLHKADGGDVPGQRSIADLGRLDAGDGDLVRRDLHALADSRRQRFALVLVALLALRQRHGADRALVRVIADDGGVHGTPVFGARADGGFGTQERPRPLLVIGVERVPVGDDAADGREDGEEAQPGQLDQNDEVEPPPRLAQRPQPRRRVQAALVVPQVSVLDGSKAVRIISFGHEIISSKAFSEPAASARKLSSLTLRAPTNGPGAEPGR